MFVTNQAAYRGGGFYAYNCTTTLINNTIIKNFCTYSSVSAMGGGVLAYSGATINGKNNLVFLNISTTSPQCSGSVNFTYSDVDGGLSGTGNISSDPLFYSTPPTGFFFLSQTAAGQSQNSPCLDAGDPNSPMIPGSTRSDLVQDGGIVDIGFHWQSYLDRFPELKEILVEALDSQEPGTPSQQPEKVSLGVSNYPNPFNPSTNISLSLDNASPVQLAVYDLSGKLVTELFDGHLDAGSHDFLFSGKALPTGVYVYRAKVADRVLTGKALLIK
ncbi:MAG: T9SS type A sorting domain-containing protein [bacterium]